MSVTLRSYKLTIDGKKFNRVLRKYQTDDLGEEMQDTVFDYLESGYWPGSWYSFTIEKLLKDISEKNKDKEIVFYVDFDGYGEEAHSALNGKVTKLKKKWRK